MLNSKLLKSEEKAIYALRELYSRFGYSQFKMSKFEEYDFYVRNMHSLISNGVITFTDTTGKLMALKPDVTLSIIKNSKYQEGFVQKHYYDESVYRISGGSGSYKEITQTGLECIGDVGIYDIVEVVSLAIKSLRLIDNNYILDVSHAGLISALLDISELSHSVNSEVLECIKAKNTDGIIALADSKKLSEKARDIALKLTKKYKSYREVTTTFAPYAKNTEVMNALNEFSAIMYSLEKADLLGNVSIDFSNTGGMNYYSGIVFSGFIKGIPEAVLSGGQYDKLAKKMGKHSGAIGFAVYLDMLERFENSQEDFDCDIVILKDADASPEELLSAVEKYSNDGSRVMVLGKIPKNYKYRKFIDFKDIKGE